MKKLFFVVAAATLLFVGCEKEKIFEPTNAIVLKAFTEPTTKASLNGEYATVWSADDKVGLVVTNSNGVNDWFTNQECTLTEGANTTTATFTSTTSYSETDQWNIAAFFPWNGTGSTANNWYGGDVYFKMPESYSEYTSGQSYLPLVADMSGGVSQPTEMRFKHVGAAVKVTINNLPAGAHSIGMTVDGEQVYGDFHISVANAGNSAMVSDNSPADATKNTIWLNYDPANAERAFTFIFPVPTLTTPKLSFKIYDKNDVLVWSKNLKAQANSLDHADVLEMPATDITAYAQFKTFSEWSVIGTANGSNWDVDFPMKTDGNLCIAKGLPFEAGGKFKVRKDGAWTEAYGNGNDEDGNTVITDAGTYDIIFNSTTHSITVVQSGECPYPETPLQALTLAIKTVWLKQSTESTAWNTYYGGTGGTDRNVAMDDEYVYIAEPNKLWAISIADASNVTAVNVTGVSGGALALCCPRVIKNTDSSINGGKDVLTCSNVTRGGEEPKLYFWKDGINNPPTAVELVTSATGAWYGDVFTVYGTLQDGILLFDKTGGDNANGIVTFDLSGTIPAKLWLHKRLAFTNASAPEAYYPFPGDVNHGIWSPGRGVEARGKSVAIDGDLKSEGNGAFTPTITDLDYAEGRNGYVLGYNFIEWRNKRYVIYGRYNNKGVYVIEGNASDDWLTIASTASVKFRRDLIVASGSNSSANSGMDVAARVINGELYFVGQRQNIACGLYKLVYE